MLMQREIGIVGEILNFQVWSYNPSYTISVVEEILNRMQAAGGVDYVSREDDIPQIPNMFCKAGQV